MRYRLKLILPLFGLLLFSFESWESFHWNREYHHSGRYFYWGSIRLDRDPLNVHPTPSVNAKPCEATRGDCTDVELDFWVFEPSRLQQIFVFSALPAFLLEGTILIGAKHFGMSQVLIFMGTLPPLIVPWYYFLGWTGDRLLDKVRRRV